jgi:hypothetical protein
MEGHRKRHAPHYEHRQFGTLNVVVISLALILMAVVALYEPESRRPILYTAAGIVAAGFLFSSLAIDVTEEYLRWRFGPGLVRGKVALARIHDAQVESSGFSEGWGIHYTSRGWLYNVSGTRVVVVTLNNGSRFMLGTDEPEHLRDAIKQGIASHRR